MAQQTKVGNHATSIFVDEEGFTRVVYHSTNIIKFNEKVIILNSGGWRTYTTKTRMNQASSQFKLGFNVFQKDNIWYVMEGINKHPFEDGMQLTRKEVKSNEKVTA